ncbi:MAG TPA: ABC transporter permease [Terriglobales bacterium]|nr:ABC transporter permease [Terriglobales bacterium]
MASTALAPAANLKQPNVIGVCFKEAKYEFLKNLRFPMFSVSTVVLPIMFYVLFGLIMGHQAIGGIGVTTYLIPAYGTFGVIGASLFGTAAGLASERGFGWLEVKKASPMPTLAYFFAKIVMSMIFSATDVLLLLLLGATFGGVHLPALVTFKLLLTLVAGSLPFCAMGLALGYFAGPTSAPALINIFYLPMSFCSGLWIPFMFLPKFVQRVAVYLPAYHLSQLAFHLVGAGTGIAAKTHWEALIGFALICLGVARIGYQRDQRARA